MIDSLNMLSDELGLSEFLENCFIYGWISHSQMGLDFAVTKEKKSFIKLLLNDPRYQSGKKYHPPPTLINNNSLWTLLLNLGQRQLQNTIIEFRNSFIKSNPRTRILRRNLHLALKLPSLSLPHNKNILQRLLIEIRKLCRSYKCSRHSQFTSIRIVRQFDSLLIRRGEGDVHFILCVGGVDVDFRTVYVGG